MTPRRLYIAGKEELTEIQPTGEIEDYRQVGSRFGQRRNDGFAQLGPTRRTRSAAFAAKACLGRFRLPRSRRRQEHVGKGRSGIGEHIHVHVEIERSECLFSALRVAVAYQWVVAEQHN